VVSHCIYSKCDNDAYFYVYLKIYEKVASRATDTSEIVNKQGLCVPEYVI